MKRFIALVHKSWIDDKAHESSTSHKNDSIEPSQSQIQAGNYKKGHFSVHGLNITVENPKGSYRRGVDKNGNAWKTKLNHHYGYFKGSVGRDKDHVDCFIGPGIQNKNNSVFIVNQVNPDSGRFDEHKVMIGFKDMKSAKEAYLSNYDKNWKGLGSIKEVTLDQFKEWLADKNKTKVIYKAFWKSMTSESIQPLRIESFAHQIRAKKYKATVKTFTDSNPGIDPPAHIKKMDAIVKYFEKYYGEVKV